MDPATHNPPQAQGHTIWSRHIEKPEIRSSSSPTRPATLMSFTLPTPLAASTFSRKYPPAPSPSPVTRTAGAARTSPRSASRNPPGVPTTPCQCYRSEDITHATTCHAGRHEYRTP